MLTTHDAAPTVTLDASPQSEAPDVYANLQEGARKLDDDEILLMYTEKGQSIKGETVVCACTARTETCRSDAIPSQA